MKHLRWLAFLGVFGTLGWITGYEGFNALFGFFAFIALFWYDERTEALFKQATAVTFVVNTMAFTGTFIYLALALGPGFANAENVNLVSIFALALAFTYIVHILTFVVTFVYFSLRGFGQ